MNFRNAFGLILISLIFIVGLNAAFASDNVTDTASEISFSEEPVPVDVSIEDAPIKGSAQIEIKGIESYYKEKSTLAGYLKDADGNPIPDRQLSVVLDGKTYNRTTDDTGKIALNINLKPNSYRTVVKFEGDDEYNFTQSSSLIKIKKTPLTIKIKEYSTYEHSDLFFKAKVYNSATKKPAAGIKVLFKVYSTKTKKYSYYYSTSNEKGIAVLKKNLKVGTYRISVQIRESKKYFSHKNPNARASMKVKPTKEKGCCSFYVQVSSSESICGFRRDGTYSADIYVKNVKWYGKAAVKQYKLTGDYFFHLVTTADGWMVGNGGIEGASGSRYIEKIAADMVKSKKIKKASLKKIQQYKRSLDFGHFSIKAPNGEFAVVWKSGYITGKLKAGEYLSAPNMKSYYRHGAYSKFSTDPVKAAIKVGATDKYGVNRRQVIILHWTATTKNYKTTAKVDAYAANDDGKLVGKSTARLKDNIRFKNKFFSKNSLPKTPKYKFLGSHSFGNIDKLIKTPTTISAPEVTNAFNQTGYFKATVKNKNTKKAVGDIKIMVKVSMGNVTKSYTLKTDKNGIAKIDTSQLSVGSYDVVIGPANNKYLISAKSKITISET